MKTHKKTSLLQNDGRIERQEDYTIPAVYACSRCRVVFLSFFSTKVRVVFLRVFMNVSHYGYDNGSDETLYLTKLVHQMCLINKSGLKFHIFSESFMFITITTQNYVIAL